MSHTKQELIEKLKELKKNNDEFTFDVTDLSNTECNRAEVMSSIYTRKNRDLRLKNISDIDKEFSTKGKMYNQSPEKYTVSQVSIKRSYVEQINRFMREYNLRFMNIQNEIYRAQENQKILMFKSCKYSNSKKIYMFSKDYEDYLSQKQQLIMQYKQTQNPAIYQAIESMEDPCVAYDRKILNCKNKIKLYENIIAECDEELQRCTTDREKDFETLFGEEQALVVKQTGYKRFLEMFKDMFDGNRRFTTLVVKKHANRINELKISKMNECADKIKKDTVIFSKKLEDMLNNNGE